MSSYKLLFFFVFILGSVILTVNSVCKNLNKYVAITHQGSGLALDTQDDVLIEIQSYTNSVYQQWKLQPSKRIGLFNIIAKKNGQALDIDGKTNGANAKLAAYNDSDTQQWFVNSEGTIMNGGYVNHTLDIYDNYITIGNKLIVWNRYDNDYFDNEKFYLNYTESCKRNPAIAS